MARAVEELSLDDGAKFHVVGAEFCEARDGGRLLPDGLKYLDSWIEPNFGRCFQLMECDDLTLFQRWALEWRGSGATIEIVPVVSSKDTRELVAPYLDDA